MTDVSNLAFDLTLICPTNLTLIPQPFDLLKVNTIRKLSTRGLQFSPKIIDHCLIKFITTLQVPIQLYNPPSASDSYATVPFMSDNKSSDWETEESNDHGRWNPPLVRMVLNFAKADRSSVLSFRK